ncbi:hypothetical protein N7326_05560 [Corynebacterium sp. ES2794-CONJ1]|uniref:hypothetical protein n=1 Tax=unclassified Corynebacterium TaxID=2624378 RepID=UPI00216A92A9|nr:MULTISPECIES: hypothetical protein [unclassified Corynebacterium]MCS4491836.1 hypothetical protein [Corynebacterium sp. ES2715-CONJ3]MCS4531941.1 hypothetical protein [Corynebacterium sp. ES2730-CONJ]MCU9519342.1 hypothetical protein [Corynebacterium sp. ES2794-CONJ1]
MDAFARGEFPGTDLESAADIISSETGSLRAIPRLVQRGLGADLVGHTMAVIEELPVDIGPRSWRLSARPQQISRRLFDMRERDLDQLVEFWGRGDIHCHVMGPWSLASRIELPRGHRAITDRGAVEEIFTLFAAGVQQHILDLKKRFGKRVTLAIYEPDVKDLMRGTLPGTSDFDRIPAMNMEDLAPRLAHCVSVLPNDNTWLYLRSREDFQIVQHAQFPGLMADIDSLCTAEILDACGEAVASGMPLALGAVNPKKPYESETDLAQRVIRLADEWAIDRCLLLERLSITHTGDLSEGSQLDAAHTLERVRKVAQILEYAGSDL